MNKILIFCTALISLNAGGQNVSNKNPFLILSGDTVFLSSNTSTIGTLHTSIENSTAVFANNFQSQNYLSSALYHPINKTDSIDLSNIGGFSYSSLADHNMDRVSPTSATFQLYNSLNLNLSSTENFINGAIVTDDSLIQELYKLSHIGISPQNISSTLNLNATFIAGAFPVPSKEFLASAWQEEQHDVDAVSFYRTDYTKWAVASDNDNGNTDIGLYTASKLFPTNNNGSYFIQTASGNLFAVGVDSVKAYIGWSKQSNLPFDINASSVDINGLLKADSGIIVSGEYHANNIKLPKGIEAYFVSNTNSTSGIIIENQNLGDMAGSGITIKQGNVANTLTTYTNYSLGLSGAFIMQSNSASGMLFNTTENEYGVFGPLRFSVNSKEVFRADNIYGSFLIGTSTPEHCSILTISSTNQGLLPPRMTSKERKAIGNLVEGLIVYDKDLHKICVYGESGWEKVNSEKIE